MPPERFDEYRLVQLLGRGGMGQVWLAHDAVLDRLVAIKFISELPRCDAARQRFLIEARAAARVQHPNIITVHRVGELGLRPYLISEYVRGESLDRIARPVPARCLFELALGLARGLAAAHRRGVLHRDLKPANAILSESGDVKLLDFGLAKLLPHGGDPAPGGRPSAAALVPATAPALGAPVDRGADTLEVPGAAPGAPDTAPGAPGTVAPPGITRAGAVMGTPAYMAPEVWRGEPATTRSDIYALGAMLYELGAGAPPHPGCPEDVRTAALARDAPPLADTASGIDPRFAAIVDRCLQRDPAARFPSGEEVRAALEALTGGGRPGRPDRRRRRGAAVVAMAALAAMAWAPWSHSAPRSTAPAAPAAPVLLARHRPGGGSWRMTLAADGWTAVRDDADRTSLWLEDLRTGASIPLPLPPGQRISRRIDALPGASRGAGTVLVRMQDLSLWRTGRNLRAAELVRARGNGAACVHPSGDRIAVSRAGEPLEVLDLRDGRRLATGPAASVCSWIGERIALADGTASMRIRILEPDGRVRDLIELAGLPGWLAADRRGRLVASHHLSANDELPTGTLTVLSLDGDPAPVPLHAVRAIGYPLLAGTDRGLFAARVPHSRSVALIRAPAPGEGPAPLRSLEGGADIEGAMVWLDDQRLALGAGGDGPISIRRVVGPLQTAQLPVRGAPVGRRGDELLVLRRASHGADDLRPRCALVAVVGARQRPVGEWECTALRSLRCDAGRCVIGVVDGDRVHLSWLDPDDGRLSPPVITRPVASPTTVAVGPDGRWLIAGGDELLLVDPATGASRPVPVRETIDDVAWGHDGSYAIGTSRSGADFSLLRITLDGRTTVIAQSAGTDLWHPRVSPDGAWIALLGTERLPEYVLFDGLP